MKPLTQQDINRYRQDIKQNHIQGVVRTYADLLSKGYNYAGWAKGVAEAEGMTWSSLPKGETTGRAAVMFMKDSSGQTFSEQKLNRIREGMAEGYLDFLESQLGKPPRDVRFDEMRDFHKQVFEKNGLSINNWTLETPMKLIGKYEGERRQEEIWQKLLATRGSGIGALTESAVLYQAVEDYAQGHIYFNNRGERIGNTVAHSAEEDNDGIPVIMGDTLQVRRVSEADRMEATKWIRNVSRFKPLLFSEAEQAQEMQYTAAAKQDDFLSATNDLIARLKSGDQTALSDFMGRDDVRQIQRESAMMAQRTEREFEEEARQREMERMAQSHSRGMSIG